MKIKNIIELHKHGNLQVSLMCSHCGWNLFGCEHYCPNCGEKLILQTTMFPMGDVIAVMNKHLRYDESKHDVVQVDKGLDAGLGELKSKGSRVCPRGKGAAIGCEYLEGAKCKGICYLTNPPQYDPCVFAE